MYQVFPYSRFIRMEILEEKYDRLPRQKQQRQDDQEVSARYSLSLLFVLSVIIILTFLLTNYRSTNCHSCFFE